jgi:hypothetical protein
LAAVARRLLTQFGDQVGAGQLGMTHREVVVDLERMRYVRRVPDPDDRRARLIQIDKRGTLEDLREITDPFAATSE